MSFVRFNRQEERLQRRESIVAYCLKCNNVQTLDVFGRDAICLARVRLSPFDPTLRDLYATWGNLLARDGNYELAAKW